MSRAFCTVLFVAISSVLIAAPPDSDIDPTVRTILLRDLKFSAAELSDLQRGKAVRHTLPTRSPGEVAVVGGIRINAPKAAFFAGVRDITHFKRGPEVLEIGTFSHPPALEDLAALTVEEGDFDARACRVGNCGIRLSADAIGRVRDHVDPNAADAQARTAAWFKAMLLAQVTAYASGGPGRFSQFDDGPMPIRPMDAFQALADEDAATLDALVAGLSDHLVHYPKMPLADGEDFLYWSKEEFGMAPFISVTHVAIVCPTASTCVMATKDVYSSRYFDASLALSIATDVAGHPDSFYLVYANRSRANALKGAFAAFRRSIVERRARNGLDESLETIKSRLEDARK